MKIVSAAIRYTLRNATNNKMYERVFMCVRYNDRFIKEAIKQFKRDRLFVYKEERGFITSAGKFVLPIEAKEIAANAGQAVSDKRYLELEELY